MRSRPHQLRVALGLVGVLAAAALMLRAAAPSNFHTKDQPKIGMYVIDMLDNGRWLLPRSFDRGVELATKPPLIAWLGAGVSAAAGTVNEITLKVPVALAFLATALLTVWIGARIGSPRIGLIAGLAVILNYHMLNYAWIARPDMLLVALVWGAIACFVALETASARTRRAWRVALWFCIALAVLTKGPPGLLAPLAAIVADLAWRKRLREARALLWPVWGMFGVGVVVGLWLIPTMLRGGEKFWDETLVSELLHRFTGAGEQRDRVRLEPWYYVMPILGRMAPWSLLLIAGVPTLWCHRRDRSWRARPLVWSGAIYLALWLPVSKRADHILPIYPALALVCAQLLVHWAAKWHRRGVMPRAVQVGALLSVAAGFSGAAVFLWQVLDEKSRTAPMTPITAALGVTLFGASLIGVRLMLARTPRAVLAGLCLVTLTALQAHLWFVTDDARTHDGEHIAQFAANVDNWLGAAEARTRGRVRFGHWRPDCLVLCVHLRRLQPEIPLEERAAFIAEPPWAVTTSKHKLDQILEALGDRPLRIAVTSPHIEDLHARLLLVVSEDLADISVPPGPTQRE